jgi:hypothetical protein
VFDNVPDCQDCKDVPEDRHWLEHICRSTEGSSGRKGGARVVRHFSRSHLANRPMRKSTLTPVTLDGAKYTFKQKVGGQFKQQEHKQKRAAFGRGASRPRGGRGLCGVCPGQCSLELPPCGRGLYL